MCGRGCRKCVVSGFLFSESGLMDRIKDKNILRGMEWLELYTFYTRFQNDSNEFTFG
jgi:hypothetical protein